MLVYFLTATRWQQCTNVFYFFIFSNIPHCRTKSPGYEIKPAAAPPPKNYTFGSTVRTITFCIKVVITSPIILLEWFDLVVMDLDY